MAKNIFLSFARQDEPLAQRLCTMLETAGMPCWLVSRDANPAADRLAEIIHAICDAAITIAVVTRAADNEAQVWREIELAGDRRRLIIAARLEDVIPTGTLAHN